MVDTINTDASLPDITTAEAEKAQKQGILDTIAEDAGARFKQTDGIEDNDPEVGIVKTSDVFHLQDLVDLEPDALKLKLDGKDGFSLTEGQIAGLLEVERSGKNRTDVVQVLCKRLGIKTPYEVTDAGPNYTNDVNRSVVKPRG